MNLRWFTSVVASTLLLVPLTGCSSDEPTSDADNGGASSGGKFSRGGAAGSPTAHAGTSGSSGSPSQGGSNASAGAGATSTSENAGAPSAGATVTGAGSGGTNAGGTNAGGTNAGGTNAGGTNAGGQSGTSGGASGLGTGGAGALGNGGTSVAGVSGNVSEVAGAGVTGVAGSSVAAGGTGVAGIAGSAGTAGAVSPPACSQANDTCPSGSYCAVSGACVAGCKDSAACPSGEYCDANHVCVRGCRDHAACVSGNCSATHDCVNCLSDTECAAGNSCGSGTCAPACDAGAAVSGCSGTSTCCSARCVQTSVEFATCGNCNVQCSTGQFCATGTCRDTEMSNACAGLGAVGILVGIADDASTRLVLEALKTNCPTTTREVAQATADVINPTTGQPIGRGEMIVAFGGDFYQKITGYLEGQRIAPIYPAYSTSAGWGYKKSVDDAVVASLASSQISATHDLVIVELIRDAVIGVPIILGYGIGSTGTQAAAWYFVNVIMPSLSSYGDSWYVLEWIDAGDTGPSAAGEYTIRASG